MTTETMTLAVGDTVHYHFFTRHERVLTEDDHAVILNHDPCGDPGCVEDIVYNRDSALTAIQAGCTAVALNPEDQAALDYERELYVDCFGG